MAEARHSGEVSRWRADRGWGFIRRDDGLADIFVHHQSIDDPDPSRFRTLLEGERVEFSVRTRAERTEAVSVTGPGGAAVVGQPTGAEVAPRARWFAVTTVSPDDAPAAEHAAGASGGPGCSGAASDAPGARAAARPFVPRSVSRATTVIRRPSDQALIAVDAARRPIATASARPPAAAAAEAASSFSLGAGPSAAAGAPDAARERGRRKAKRKRTG